MNCLISCSGTPASSCQVELAGGWPIAPQSFGIFTEAVKSLKNRSFPHALPDSERRNA